MATTQLSHHQIPGALGPVLIDVRATGRAQPQPAVLLVHGFKGFKDYALMVQMAERLAKAGFTAVNLSVSGSGVDQHGEFVFFDRFGGNTYTRELGDIELVIAGIRDGDFGFPPPTSLGLVGHSRGGGVSLCVARETPGVDAIVTWAAMSTIVRYSDAELAIWRRLGTIYTENVLTGRPLPMRYEIVEDALAHLDRFDILAAAANLRIPWLLIHGTADETIPIAEGRALAAAATDPRFEALFIAGASHGFGGKHPWTGAAPETTELFDRTAQWCIEYLR
jgi:dienelactone hydrolase